MERKRALGFLIPLDSVAVRNLERPLLLADTSRGRG